MTDLIVVVQAAPLISGQKSLTMTLFHGTQMNVFSALLGAGTSAQAAEILSGIDNAALRVRVDTYLVRALHASDWQAADRFTTSSPVDREKLIAGLNGDWKSVQKSFAQFAPLDAFVNGPVTQNAAVILRDSAPVDPSFSDSGVVTNRPENIALIVFQETLRIYLDRARDPKLQAMDPSEIIEFGKQIEKLNTFGEIADEEASQAKLVILFHLMKRESAAFMEFMIPLQLPTPIIFFEGVKTILQTFNQMADQAIRSRSTKRLGQVVKLRGPLKAIRRLVDAASKIFPLESKTLPIAADLDLVERWIEIAENRLSGETTSIRERTGQVLALLFDR